ncbi:MAG: hypothetical protein Q9M08_07815 [Mariprofundus sp.]|nr:hypothetical protein [Mariprofundus sp.]
MRCSKAVVLATLLIAANLLAACSSEDPIEEEISHVTNEGPYGGHSLGWYKTHWRGETTEQRKWCRQQKETRASMQSCIDANIGWKQGWKDPETNPPRSWRDGSRTDQ